MDGLYSKRVLIKYHWSFPHEHAVTSREVERAVPVNARTQSKNLVKSEYPDGRSAPIISIRNNGVLRLGERKGMPAMTYILLVEGGAQIGRS